MKQGLKLGGHALGTYVVALFLSLAVLASIGPDWYWAQVALNALLLAGMAFMMYAGGGAQGEHAATMTATVERMRQDGREVAPELNKKCFAPRAALACYLTCMLPLMLVAAVNLAAEPYYPPVIAYEAEEEEAPAAASGEESAVPPNATAGAEAAESEPYRLNPYSIVARAVFLPVLSAYRPFGQNPHGLNLVFLGVALLVPLPEALGYLAGPRLRRKKLEAIQKGKRRKMRNLKVNKKPRGPREPKHEV